MRLDTSHVKPFYSSIKPLPCTSLCYSVIIKNINLVKMKYSPCMRRQITFHCSSYLQETVMGQNGADEVLDKECQKMAQQMWPFAPFTIGKRPTLMKSFLQILNVTQLILVLESTESMLDLFLNFNDSALVQVLLRWCSLLHQQKTVACVHPLWVSDVVSERQLRLGGEA